MLAQIHRKSQNLRLTIASVGKAVEQQELSHAGGGGRKQCEHSAKLPGILLTWTTHLLPDRALLLPGTPLLHFSKTRLQKPGWLHIKLSNSHPKAVGQQRGLLFLLPIA